MHQRTPLKDFKDLSSKFGKGKATTNTNLHPQAFDLDEDDPELDLKTWTTLEHGAFKNRVYQKLQPGEMSVKMTIPSFERKRLNLAKEAIIEASHLHIRFGAKLLRNLGWKAGEGFAVFQHPQDKSVFGIMPKAKGLKLRPEGRIGTVSYMTFKFPNDQKRLTAPSAVVEFVIHENGYLLFRLPPVNKDDNG